MCLLCFAHCVMISEKIFGGYIPWNEFIVLRILNRTNKEMVSRVANELNVSNSHITAVTEKIN